MHLTHPALRSNGRRRPSAETGDRAGPPAQAGPLSGRRGPAPAHRRHARTSRFHVAVGPDCSGRPAAACLAEIRIRHANR